MGDLANTAPAGRTRIGISALLVGAYGTAVFGNGVNAVTGEVVGVGADYLELHAPAPDGTVYLIPLAALVYFRPDHG